jgi:hypothetical protein
VNPPVFQKFETNEYYSSGDQLWQHIALGTDLLMLGFSQAADNNKQAILEVLSRYLTSDTTALEVGSGSGQHAIHFAQNLAQLSWWPTELGERMGVLRDNLSDSNLPNIANPVALDVALDPWPVAAVDCVYTANTLHIMSWPLVVEFMRGAAQVVRQGGLVCVYGPFRYQGDFTTPSNERFDAWLKERDSQSGIRDFEALDALAAARGFVLAADIAMPANNQFLLWRRDSV